MAQPKKSRPSLRASCDAAAPPRTPLYVVVHGDAVTEGEMEARGDACIVAKV
jgi:hypothetical protein